MNKSILIISSFSLSVSTCFLLPKRPPPHVFILIFSFFSFSTFLSSSFQNLSKLDKIEYKNESTSVKFIFDKKYNLYTVSIFSLLLKQDKIIVFSILVISFCEINSSYVSLSSLLNKEFSSMKSLNKKLFILFSLFSIILLEFSKSFFFSMMNLYLSQSFS